MQIIKATSAAQLEKISALAFEILPEVYDGYLPAEHVIFFLQKFQTPGAIQKQISEDYEYYLLEHNETAFGYIGLQLSPNKMVLSKLYMLKGYRSKGWGDKAMAFINDRSMQLGSKKIQLVVHRNNRGAIKFYKQRGFVITRPLLHSFENGHSVEDYLMTKVFSPSS